MATIKFKRGTRAQLDAAASANGLIEGEPYYITDEEIIAIGTSENSYKEYTSGASWSISQEAHGLSVGNPIYFDGADWVKAQADSVDHVHVGIVSAVADVDNFTITISGTVSGLSGLTSGTWYYLSQNTAGEFVAIAPTTGVVAAIFQATSTTTALIIPYIPQEEAVGSPITVDLTVTTADVTAVAGKHYRLDVSGMTADRNFILPSGVDLQEISFELVTDAPDDYELIIKGDTGISGRLRSNDAVTANEITRCFIRGESMRWVHDGTDWVCNARDDGRIAQFAQANLTTAASGETAGAVTIPTDANGAWTENVDVGGIFTVADGKFTFRRDCGILIIAFGQASDTCTDNSYFEARILQNGSTVSIAADYVAGTGNPKLSPSVMVDCSAGDYVQLAYRSSQGSRGLAVDVSNISVRELW